MENRFFKHVYSIGIVDDLSLYHPLREYELELEHRPSKLNMLKEAALFLLCKTYWEGDGEFYIFPVLNASDIFFPITALLIKQENNGATFVVSDKPIRELFEYEIR